MKFSYKIAFCGVMSSMCLVLMFLAGAIPLAYILLSALPGMLVMLITFEVGLIWGVLTYLAVGILSLFITFDKEAALFFIGFFGVYPLFKFYFDKIKLIILRRGLKFLIMVICVLINYYFTVFVLGIDDVSDSSQTAKNIVLISQGICLLFFVYFDSVLDFSIKFYRKKLRHRVVK
ncbi:MAG: hypothetical protein LBL93_00665 [Ruminococcus sp.]|jgi:hypothetical protein|nr:hypothetical protein [Ruminococcus sp.]